MSSKNRALFLDRDGIVNMDKGYVGSVGQFEFVPGIFECVRRYQAQGYHPVIITNQSGIGRGLYSEAAFLSLCDWMQQQFALRGIDAIPVYYCPHHPTDAVGEYRRQCQCRKPAPGLFFTAASELDLDLSESVMVGDSWRDMQAAFEAGVRKLVWVKDTSEQLPDPELPVVRVSQVTDIPLLS